MHQTPVRQHSCLLFRGEDGKHFLVVSSRISVFASARLKNQGVGIDKFQKSIAFKTSPFPLRIEESAKHLWPPFLVVAVPLESTFQNGLNSLLCFRPCQRGRKGVEGVEKAVGGWQRYLINKVLRRRDRTPVKRCNPARPRA